MPEKQEFKLIGGNSEAMCRNVKPRENTSDLYGLCLTTPVLFLPSQISMNPCFKDGLKYATVPTTL